MANHSSFSAISDILSKFEKDKDKYISFEFQKYGYDLAEELDDLTHKALYIKLAKESPRSMLENARNYVKDAYNVKNKAKLFMWRMSILRKEMKGRSKKS